MYSVHSCISVVWWWPLTTHWMVWSHDCNSTKHPCLAAIWHGQYGVIHHTCSCGGFNECFEHYHTTNKANQCSFYYLSWFFHSQTWLNYQINRHLILLFFADSWFSFSKGHDNWPSVKSTFVRKWKFLLEFYKEYCGKQYHKQMNLEACSA